MDLKDKRIVFVGLDDVLIKTHSNQEKPVGVWDMEFNLNVLDKLKQLNPIAIFVVSNQPDIPAKLHHCSKRSSCMLLRHFRNTLV